jgi:iron(III) transport system substrate-binding protein
MPRREELETMDRRLNRRLLLRGLVGGAAAAVTLPLLAACGGDDDDPTATSAAVPTNTGAPAEPTATSGSGQATATEAASTATAPAATETTSAVTTEPSATEAAATATESAATATGGASGSITVYSGRSEALVAPVIEQFTAATGIEVEVRYAGTTELAATILEEGDNSPADVFFAQDAGALGAIEEADLFAMLPDGILGLVDERFRSDDGEWVGISGRARVVVYNTDALTEADIPASILDFTDSSWDGRLGWAPTNASFQSFITALRELEGEDGAQAWLEGLIANNTTSYEGNTQIVEAVIAGEIDAGFVNHYYLYQIIRESGEVPAENFWYTDGDPGALVNVAGAGILTTSQNPEGAAAFIEYLLSEEGQLYFSEETFEYPLVTGIAADPRLVPLDEIQVPDIDLSDLDDLAGTLALLTEVGLI